MKYLLDTCVVSELVSKKPDKNVVRWIDGIDSEIAYLSVITIGEIQRGIEKISDATRKIKLQQWLDVDLMEKFEGRIISLDLPIMMEWGRLTARMQSMGKPLPAVDSMIAAIAIHHNYVLVTRNEKDFQASGVTLLNPWEWKTEQ